MHFHRCGGQMSESSILLRQVVYKRVFLKDQLHRMTINEFMELDEADQAEALTNKACIIGRDEDQFKVLLYQVDSFYVEVYYHKGHREIKRLLPFEDTDLLAPYLHKIDISQLI